VGNKYNSLKTHLKNSFLQQKAVASELFINSRFQPEVQAFVPDGRQNLLVPVFNSRGAFHFPPTGLSMAEYN
jgi:hypothetical protein